MSFVIPLETNKNIVVRPAITREFNELVVEKIIDSPEHKTVEVFISSIGLVKLNDLSDANYDNPQWNNESLMRAVISYANSV